jgi:hypothetical protein
MDWFTEYVMQESKLESVSTRMLNAEYENKNLRLENYEIAEENGRLKAELKALKEKYGMDDEDVRKEKTSENQNEENL